MLGCGYPPIVLVGRAIVRTPARLAYNIIYRATRTESTENLSAFRLDRVNDKPMFQTECPPPSAASRMQGPASSGCLDLANRKTPDYSTDGGLHDGSDNHFPVRASRWLWRVMRTALCKSKTTSYRQ